MPKTNRPRRPHHPVQAVLRSAVPARLLGSWRSLGRPARIGIAATTGALVLLAGYLLLSGGEPGPRARQYLAFKACLLTGSGGITEKPASQIWSGMETASLKTHARVQYQPVFGPDTLANAMPYLNSLVQRRCDIIVATGKSSVDAVNSRSRELPKNRFIVVGGSAAGANVVTLGATDDAMPQTIARLITKAV